MTTPSARIELCGRLGVEWDGERLEGALPGRQGRLLFAYLALHRDRPVRRDELLEVLWSEEGPPPGGDSLLAPPLSRLRKALGPDRLTGRSELSLALPADAWLDWEALDANLAAARAHGEREEWAAALEAASAALGIADRGLLPGLEAAWIDEFRARLADLRIEALEAVAQAGVRCGGGALPGAEQSARAAVEAAPFRESAHAALMEALRAQGNYAEALRAYEELRTLLREELGSSPGPALAELHQELLHAQPSSTAAPTPEPSRSGALPDRLAQAATSPLVGREGEVERLRAELREAKDGRTGLVLITGEGGIGKTRLVAQVASEADGFTVLYGRCDEEQLFPFGPWIEMLSGHLAGVADSELAGLLGAEAPDLARLLPELRARLPGLEERAGGDPETERRRLFAAVERLVIRLAQRRPLLLAIDDLHWADHSSLLLGRQLVRSAGLGQVLMLGTYRDNELPPRHPLVEILGDLEREQPLPRIGLEGLDEDAVGSLVRESSGADAAGDRVRAIREETEGNPFFVKQLVRHLAEQGGGSPQQSFSVPAGVRDVILRRIARLPESAGPALEVAALVGRDFELSVLERVLDLTEDELLDALDAAVRAALLVEVPSTPGRYSFAHALMRTTLEGELTATRRARLHRRIGEAIEEGHPGRLDPYLADLARHFGAAGPEEADRAVTYATRAAEQASARLAYEEAVELLTAAVAARERDVPVDQADLSRLLSLLAGAKWRTGAWEEPRADFMRAAAAAREANAPEHFARAALGHAGGVWEQFGTQDPASVELLEEALVLLPDGDSALRAQVMSRLSNALYYATGPEQRMPELVTKAVAMARRLDDPEALVSALAATQNAHWLPGQAEKRLETAHELVEATERSGDLHHAGEAHAWRAIALLELCRLDEADADLRRYAEIADRLQHPVMLVHRDAIRSMRALLDGRWQDAEDAAAAVWEAGERVLAEGLVPTPLHLQFYGVEMIALRNEQLRMAEVGQYFGKLVAEIGALPGWRTPVAWAHAQGGEPELARAELEDLRPDAFAAFPRDVNFVPAMAILSHVAGELADPELAAELEPLLRPYAGSWVVLGPAAATLGPVDYCLGLVNLLIGDVAAAESDFARAVELSERMGARPYLAHSMLGRAVALGDDEPEEAARLRAEAVAIGRELDMPRLLRDAERLSPAAP